MTGNRGGGFGASQGLASLGLTTSLGNSISQPTGAIGLTMSSDSLMAKSTHGAPQPSNPNPKGISKELERELE